MISYRLVSYPDEFKRKMNAYSLDVVAIIHANGPVDPGVVCQKIIVFLRG